MFRGHPWLVAVDADDAGERSARNWLELSGRCFRTAPPSGIGKVWSDAHQAGLDLRAYWAFVLQSLGQDPSAHPERANTGSDPRDEDLSSDAEEYAPMGLTLQGPSRWRCLNRYCLTKGRWWMSRYGVVRCMNCQPPSFPWLIIEEGDAARPRWSSESVPAKHSATPARSLQAFPDPLVIQVQHRSPLPLYLLSKDNHHGYSSKHLEKCRTPGGLFVRRTSPAAFRLIRPG